MIAKLGNDGFAVSAVCEVLQVRRAGYYAYRQRTVTQRERRDDQLRPLIQKIFWQNHRRYGVRRIRKDLAALGERCGDQRIGRLMKEMRLQAIQPRSFRPRTTQSRHTLGDNPNLLLDTPMPTAVKQIWVGDITYIPLKYGRFAYLAVLRDLFSRRIVGWDLREHMKESRTLAALKIAIAERQPSPGLIHHSDRAGQYAGNQYRRILARAAIRRAGSGSDRFLSDVARGTFRSLRRADLRRRLAVIF